MKGNDASHAGEPTAASRQGLANSPRRILVVEDDLDIGQLYAEVLVGSGYEVALAGDGAAGWEALCASHFDLLITDHEMPKLTGLELVGKARCAHLTLPVIVASGALHTEELKRRAWLHVAAVLLKPVSVQELLETVKEVLANPILATSGPEVCDPTPGNLPGNLEP